jgi:peptidoglycan/LPS O-acetylase OafA/YrhL
MTAVAAAPAPDGVQAPGRVAFPHLDAFRALGATAVVATHVAFQTGRTLDGPFAAGLSRLDIGVAVFFVISGFLLTRPYVEARAAGRPAPGIRTYLWRRALRVLPAYWLVVAACLLFLPASRGGTAGDWARHLTLTQIYGWGAQKKGLTQTWSLCTEVVFYAALPLLACGVLLVARRTWRPGTLIALFAGGGVVLSTAWQIAIHYQPGADVRVQEQWLPGFLGWFGIGAALSVAHVHLRREPRDRRWRWLDDVADQPWTCWVIAVGVFAVATTPLAGPRGFEDLASPGSSVFKSLAYLTASGFLLLPAMFGTGRQDVARTLLASRPVQYLGRISYGLFLWHLLVLEVVVAVLHLKLFTGSFVVVFGLTWGLSVLAAALSWRYVEAPVLRWKNRGPGRRTTPPTAVPARTGTAAG